MGNYSKNIKSHCIQIGIDYMTIFMNIKKVSNIKQLYTHFHVKLHDCQSNKYQALKQRVNLYCI